MHLTSAFAKDIYIYIFYIIFFIIIIIIIGVHVEPLNSS